MPNFLIISYLSAFKISCSAEHRKSFITSGPESKSRSENDNGTEETM